MGLFDAFCYNGKRAVVVGGATGMGAAVAEVVKDAGAEVVVMDRAEIGLGGVKSIRLDLADKASIDAAVDECGGPIDALFSCAGVADGTPGIERINFIGHRYMIERLLDQDLLPRGSAIGMISSAAGLGWESNLDLLLEFLEIGDFDEATAWAHDHDRATYMWSKQAINAYVAREALGLLQARASASTPSCPGPTNTPLAQANADTWLSFGADYREVAGIEASTPLEQAYPLVFLCSDAAAGVTGITMITDAGLRGLRDHQVVPDRHRRRRLPARQVRAGLNERVPARWMCGGRQEVVTGASPSRAPSRCGPAPRCPSRRPTPGSAASTSSSATRPSRRASAAPRQKWMP